MKPVHNRLFNDSLQDGPVSAKDLNNQRPLDILPGKKPVKFVDIADDTPGMDN
jgi:hypothetical protein